MERRERALHQGGHAAQSAAHAMLNSGEAVGAHGREGRTGKSRVLAGRARHGAHSRVSSPNTADNHGGGAEGQRGAGAQPAQLPDHSASSSGGGSSGGGGRDGSHQSGRRSSGPRIGGLCAGAAMIMGSWRAGRGCSCSSLLPSEPLCNSLSSGWSACTVAEAVQ